MFISENSKYLEQHPLFQDSHYYVVKDDVSARVRGSNVHGTIPKGSILQFTGEANAENETVTMADCKYVDAKLVTDSYYIIQTDQLEQSLKDCTDDLLSVSSDNKQKISELYILRTHCKEAKICRIAALILAICLAVLVFVRAINNSELSSYYKNILFYAIFTLTCVIFFLNVGVASLFEHMHKKRIDRKLLLLKQESEQRFDDYIRSVAQ